MKTCYTYTYKEKKNQTDITVFKTLYGWQAVSKYGTLWDEHEQNLKQKMELRISSYWRAEELNKKTKKIEKIFKESRK